MNRSTINLPFVTAAAALAIAAVVVVLGLSSVLGVLFGPSLNDDAAEGRLAGLLDIHEKEMDRYVERVKGRSLFYKPRPTPIQVVRTPVEIDEPDEPEIVEPPRPVGPPPPPATYGGPQIAYAAMGEVVFINRGGEAELFALSLGEEFLGVKLMEMNPPRSVKLGWSGGEYEVPLFQWTTGALDNEPLTRVSTTGLSTKPDFGIRRAAAAAEIEQQRAAQAAGAQRAAVERMEDDRAAAEAAGEDDDPEAGAEAGDSDAEVPVTEPSPEQSAPELNDAAAGGEAPAGESDDGDGVDEEAGGGEAGGGESGGGESGGAERETGAAAGDESAEAGGAEEGASPARGPADPMSPENSQTREGASNPEGSVTSGDAAAGAAPAAGAAGEAPEVGEGAEAASESDAAESARGGEAVRGDQEGDSTTGGLADKDKTGSTGEPGSGSAP